MKMTVAVMKEDQVVGHIPYNLAPIVKMVLGFAEVTRTRVNRGAGYGLEIPCKYSFYGPKT